MAKKKKKKTFHWIKLTITVILTISSLIAYGYFIEPKKINYKEYQIKNENLTDNFNGFKIVHISDIHYGNSYDKKMLKKLVKSINNQKPDIVVLTGDLIAKDTKMTIDLAKEISTQLKKINVNIDKYAINGDEDLKFDEWVNIIKDGGFTNLNNTYDTIYKDGYSSLLIAGTTTSKDKVSINDKLEETTTYINSFEKDGPLYKILILHEPDSIDEIKQNKFDLILAGHSLGGQIKTPLGGLITKEGAQKYYNNYYKLDNSKLYVSNGLGTSTYHFRLFNTPSYNIYKLTNK